ncbi:hypothetical protein ABEF95_001092 [Exophiala dermatitidis]
MPRITRGALTIRTELSGPGASPERDKLLRLVKSIEINPKIASLLRNPTWSVSSLMPPPQAGPSSTGTSTQPGGLRSGDIEKKASSKKDKASSDAQPKEVNQFEITPSKLHHLLRLSALPPPRTEAEQTSMLRTLQQQLHFVKEIQKVDTTGVEPLVSLRDETQEARQRSEFTLESVQDFLKMEDKVGVNGTIRRRKVPVDWSKEFPRKLSAHPEKGIPDRQDDRILKPFELGVEGNESRMRGHFFFVKRLKKSEETAASEEG